MALISNKTDLAASPTQDAPKIEFPCEDYMVKVVAIDSDEILEIIFETLSYHAPEVDKSKVSAKTSSKGRFISFTFRIVATSEYQLSNLHKELIALEPVKMVI